MKHLVRRPRIAETAFRWIASDLPAVTARIRSKSTKLLVRPNTYWLPHEIASFRHGAIPAPANFKINFPESWLPTSSHYCADAIRHAIERDAHERTILRKHPAQQSNINVT